MDGDHLRDAEGQRQPAGGGVLRVHALADDSQADHAPGGIFPLPLISGPGGAVEGSLPPVVKPTEQCRIK